MNAAATYVIAGLSLLLAVVLPSVLRRVALSPPMILIAVGMLIGLLPLPEHLHISPIDDRAVIQHVTELTVLIALMGVGLALDRPLRPRDRDSLRQWNATWRMLLIAMPLCIGGVALLGWGLLGVAPAAALLLGAALAPTDPVLASDVQVEGPTVDDDATDLAIEEIDEEDEVRFTLTAEAGLNDGLAFPFVHAALLMAGAGAAGVAGGASDVASIPFSEWGGHWFLWELLGKVALGIIVGVAVGLVLGKIAFGAPRASLRLAEQGQPLLALAAMLLAYGVGEFVGGYGFLAVFICAMTIRSRERDHAYHRRMHEVMDGLEHLLTLTVLLFLGIALTQGLLANLDWRGVVLALALVLVIRPLAGMIALWVRRGGEISDLDQTERRITAFFGVRGVGSLYYLAYAGSHAVFPEERWLWSTVGFTILLSVLVHGVLVTPTMRHLDRHREQIRAASA